MATGGVFINYRGEDSDTAAALIDRELVTRFGSDRVFLDSRSIPAGVDFVEELLGRLRACSVLLVVIGRRWLTLTDAAGERRIDDPRDWIRREIVEALAHGLRIIPVLTDGVTLPAAADLPDEIARLSRRQYVPLRRRYVAVDLAFLAERITEADPELAEVARRQSGAGRVPRDDIAPAVTPTADATQPAMPTRAARRGWPGHRRLVSASIAATVVVAAGTAAALQVLDRSNSPADEGRPPGQYFTMTSPWRLIVDNNIVGANSGCTVTVTNIDTNDQTNLTEIYGKKTFQRQDTGNFRWAASNPGCHVIQQSGPGEAVLPFAHPCCGDTDAFALPKSDGQSLAKVTVQIADFKGNNKCHIELRDATDGQVLDFGSVLEGGGPLALDPNGRSHVYLATPICGIQVSAG